MQGDFLQGEENLEAGLALCREAGDSRGEALALNILGFVASERNDLERAERLLEESLALGRKDGTPVEISNALNALANVAFYRNDHARASVLQEEGLGMARAAGDVRGISIHTNNLGLRALAQNDFDLAEKRCVKIILDLQERAEVFGIDGALDVLGSIAASRGEIRRAARIWGGVEGYRDARGVPWAPEEREMIEPHIDAARTRLDGAAWEEEWERGRSMTLDQTVHYALEGSGDRAMEQG